MTREACEAKLNVFTPCYYLWLAYVIHGQKEMTLKEEKSELTQLVDVDGFAGHSFTTFTHGFDLDQIVAVGGEAELHSSLVGKKSGDVVVVVLLQEHLRREKKSKHACSKLPPSMVKETFALNWHAPNSR